MNEYIIAIVIGIVEGLTEFLPISSTGHMILAGAVLNFEGQKASVFMVFIQLGAILSVLLLYRDKFLRMMQLRKLPTNTGLSAYHVAAGIFPVMLIGFFLHKPIKTFLFSPFTVIIGLVLGGILILVAEKFAGRAKVQNVEDMTIRQAFWVGIFQILALWPGFSRSGSTIAGGLLFGMNRMAAAEFSFIIAVPLMFVACIYDLLKNLNEFSSGDLAMIAIGFLVAFATAYLSIVWFLRFLGRSTLASFAYYRFVLAAVSYYYFYA